MLLSFQSTIGHNAGCPTSQRVVYMGVASDCKYTQQYGNTQNATMNILTNWNTASALYKVGTRGAKSYTEIDSLQTTFNISLGIIELQVQDTT